MVNLLMKHSAEGSVKGAPASFPAVEEKYRNFWFGYCFASGAEQLNSRWAP